MNKLVLIFVLFLQQTVWGQSYSPPAGQQGSTAIHMDSSIFTSWATGIVVSRGFVYMEDTTFASGGSNRASFGQPSNALGKADGNSAEVVSLGDSGVAIMTFDVPIINGPGFDFAVFENSFSDDFLEFAFVEVSSDGNRFVRFPNHSEVQNQVQIHGFGLTDTRRIYNLAGKYRAGYGTPFDLEELKDSVGIDLNSITHIKIIDVIGSVGLHASYDSYGNIINEPYSSPYASGGFDLDGVGIIHELLSLTIESRLTATLFPNPSAGELRINVSNSEPYALTIRSLDGRIVLHHPNHTNTSKKITISDSGIYIVQVQQKENIFTSKFVINN